MKFISSLAILFVCLLGEAQDISENYDLAKCLQYAAGNSPLKRQHYLAEQRREMLVQLEKSKNLPQIRAYANYSYYFELPTTIFPQSEGMILSSGDSEGPYPIRLGQPHNLFAGARVSQTLFDKRWLSTNDFEQLRSQISLLSEQAVDEEMIEKVAIGYFDLQKLRSKSQLIQSRISSLTSILQILQLQADEQVINRVEVDKVTLALARLEAENTRLNGGIRSNESRLKILMGMPVDKNIDFSSDEDNLELAFQNEAKDNSVQLDLLDKQQQLGELSENTVASGYFPKVRAFADFQFQAQRNSLNFLSDERWFPNHLFGVGINVPIFTGFEKRTKIQQEGVKVEEIKLNRELAESRNQVAYENSLNNLETGRLLMENSHEQKELAVTIFEQVNLQYQQGVASLQDLLSAEIEQAEANNLYEEAKFDYKLAQISHLKSTNRLRALLQ